MVMPDTTLAAAVGHAEGRAGHVQPDAFSDAFGRGQGGVGHDHHELLAAIAAGQVHRPHVAGQANRELAQHLVAGVVAEAVVDLLEVVDVQHQGGDRLAVLDGPGHQGVELGGHVAAIVQAGELVGDRRLQALVQIRAQQIRVALALDLGAHAGCQLLGVDRAGKHVVDADVQRLGRAAPVVGVDQGQDRQVAGLLVRPQLGGEAQAVETARSGVDDHQVDRAARGQVRLLGIGLDHRAVLHPQLGG